MYRQINASFGADDRVNDFGFEVISGAFDLAVGIGVTLGFVVVEVDAEVGILGEGFELLWLGVLAVFGVRSVDGLAGGG